MNDSPPGNAGAMPMVDDIVMKDCADGDITTLESRKDDVLKGKPPENSGTSEEEDGADGDYHSPNSTPPPRSDEIDRWQYHIDLQEWGQSLHEAAKAVFPNVASSRYRNVYVLMLKWKDEDPQLPVSYDITKLWDVFKDTYGFETDLWEIPNHDSHTEVNQRIIDFSRLGGNSKEDLKILYYAGHGKITRNRLLSWTSWRNNESMKCPTVKWSGIQSVLEEAESDVLLLLDCCNAGITSTDEGQGLTELISACAYNSKANGVGYYSFTHALVLELRALSTRPSFSVGDLYSRIYCRIQSRMPDDELGTERHPAPVHLVLTCDHRFPRGIQLSPRKHRKVTEGNSTQPNLFSSSNLSDPQVTPNASLRQDKKVPRLALAIRLQDSLSSSQLSTDIFTEWLRSMPIVAEQVKVEAGFDSYSTLLIVSIPISLSGYLPSNPAVIWLGPITSSNLVLPAQPLSSHIPATERLHLSGLGKIQHGDVGGFEYLSELQSRLQQNFPADTNYLSEHNIVAGPGTVTFVSGIREIDVDQNQKPPRYGSSTSTTGTQTESMPPSVDHNPGSGPTVVPVSISSTDQNSALPETSHNVRVGPQQTPLLQKPRKPQQSSLSSQMSASDSRIATAGRDQSISGPVSLAGRAESPLDNIVPQNFHSSSSISTSILSLGQRLRGTSFLFVVNEIPTNDDPVVEGSIQSQTTNGRYYPPEFAQGFLPLL